MAVPLRAVPSRRPRLRNSPRGWAPRALFIHEVDWWESRCAWRHRSPRPVARRSPPASCVVAPRRYAGQRATVRHPLVLGAHPGATAFASPEQDLATCSRQDVAHRVDSYRALHRGWQDVASSLTVALRPTHFSDQTSLRRPPSRRVSEARGTGGNSPAGGLAMEGQAFLTRHGCLVEKPLTAPGSRP